MTNSISPASTIAAFIGQTATGPRLTPVPVLNWSSYQATFGTATTSGLLGESVRLFFINGGAEAIVISIGPDDVPVTLPDLMAGLSRLEREQATLVVAPDAVRLPSDSDYGQFADALLMACANQNRFAILDVWGGERVIPGSGLTDVIDTFRSLVNEALDRGAVYLPWVVTSSEGRTFPPSGALAGVYCRVDTAEGIWQAPANVPLLGIQGPAYMMSDAEQFEISTGKAVNALRVFAGQGLKVWGARTLDGDNPDWGHIQLRRTSIFIEQSIKLGLGNPSANDAEMWNVARAEVSAFLMDLWRLGALLGDSPEEAYSVQCGLASTMTEQDILDGYLIVQVLVALVRPTEFIELTIKQRIGDA